MAGLVLSKDVIRGPLAPHADSLRAGVSIEHRHSSGTLFAARVSLSRSVSDSEVSDYDDLRIDLFAIPTWTILGADPQFELSLRARDYDSFRRFSSHGRQDEEVGVSITLNFTKAELYGFTPVLSLDASRTKSNIGLFEVDRHSVQLGIRSAF